MAAQALVAILLLLGPLGAALGEELVLEFDRRSDGIAAEVRDPIPRLRLFDTGRILIYRPFYMRNSGLWEGRLSAPELDKLLEALSSRGVFRIDARTLEEKIAAAGRREERRSAIVSTRSETVTTVFQAHQTGDSIPDHRLVVQNLQGRADSLPVPELADLAHAERLLLDLADREDLARIGDAARPTTTGK